MIDQLIRRLNRYSKKALTEWLDEDFANALEEAKRNLKDLRNELCLRCGEYRQRHLGACDGCRWKEY